MARGKNKHADLLATLALAMTEDIPRQIKIELIGELSIGAAADWATKVATVTIVGSCWMDPIIKFLVEDRVPDDENEGNKIRWVASRY